MELLLDTHIFLWFVDDNLKLSNHLKDLIEDRNNSKYLSVASLWEMSIKYSSGKLKLETSYEQFIEEEITQTNLNLLHIKLEHLNIVSSLPFHHRDPFDRLIISQSMVEGMSIITVDSAFEQYPIKIIN
ncbi:MAG TPA: PIN domain nuclease [Cyanothece sp. UBA12306]|nr:PIN domain nuclease [Cyanothece sp. UBA12306]